MRTEPSRRASIRDSIGCLVALTIGIAAGAGGVAWATVACGSFDATTMELISVRKSGQNQPLPTQRSTSFENYGAATVFDIDRGEFRRIFVERLP